MKSLCAIYCPPLEAGLVFALASDYDLSNSRELGELRNTLDGLKDSAVAEQDLELIPQHIDEDKQQLSRRLSAKDGAQADQNGTSSSVTGSYGISHSEEDGLASVTSGITELKNLNLEGSDLDLQSDYGDAGARFDELSSEGKCKWLCSMFPNVESQNVEDTLAKCSGDFEKSTDELLNISFLNETGETHGQQEYSAPKGIEAFIQDAGGVVSKKARGKGKRRKHHGDHLDQGEVATSDSAMSSGNNTPNIWKNLPEDVEFIASHTHLRPKTITSTYHANGARLAPTIRALAIKEGETYKEPSHKAEDIIEWQIDELELEFETVPRRQLYGVLILADKIPLAAKKLLEAMVATNEQPVLLGKIKGFASYTPLDLSDDDTVSKRAMNNAIVPSHTEGYTTSHLANKHGLAATEAFQQASAAYRRGKSDHLMSGAAAYYASVGHERVKAAKSVQAAAADAHVAGQSSATILDLHGVNVSDAVRIAQRRTATWWEGLGDRKYVVGGRGDGYRIVTGVGRHSSDGIGKIGPAVSKMLVRDGWKIEIARGEIVVSGRARK